jgi:hypothetical protein
MGGSRVEPDLRFFRRNLFARHLAGIGRPLQQQPGGNLHQPCRQPHRFGGIKRGRQPRQLLGLGPAWPVEIFRRLFNQPHAFVVERLERRRKQPALGKIDGIFVASDRLTHGRHPVRSTVSDQWPCL